MFLVDLVHQARATLNRQKPNMHALSNLDLVAHAQDHFHYGYHFASSYFRPCCYGVARYTDLKIN